MARASWPERSTEDAEISIKVAVYPELGEPEVSEVAAISPTAARRKFSNLVMEKVQGSGGSVPREALQELIDNLIHAQYKGVVISILRGGDVVRVSDRGPGIEQKDRAFEFGFSGATDAAAPEIRGVGAGLGIARAAVEKAGGALTLEDNIGGGTVATISMAGPMSLPGSQTKPPKPIPPLRRYPDSVPTMNISERQQKVLITVLESREVGPSTVAERLDISVSTAYRDLSVLEEHGLVTAAESGKRLVTPLGRDLVEAIISTWVT